jgi:hypothetical protein
MVGLKAIKTNRHWIRATECFGADKWDFRDVDRIFAAFINPNENYATDKKKFLKLLYTNKGEGNSATNIISRTAGAVDNFYERNIGPIFSAMSNALSGLINLFKLNMLQTGYGLSEVNHMSKQANILNRALNDSIYYQLGRPGSLLRAVDNPFTREYGEPVIEIREPFQRIHYLSSFSHILSNMIQETTNNVSTVITAVSDGKYPVTVALDKGAPAERQVETTVETGIYFDNMIGKGFFGAIHPLLHPFETGRGISKNATGAPDELSAKRIALSHLKENIKDIYGGELLIIGNPDIRPHDLVYLSDVYERMYGIFEVEQVIHHFTSELGFVTSITPNALVTVNDPAKWFMTSWIHSWMNVQNIRNDTRLFLDALNASGTGISFGGSISIDKLADNLAPQMMGGIQFTHGSSALIKDVVASTTAASFSENQSFTEQIKAQANINGKQGIVGAKAIIGGVSLAVPILGQLIWKGWQWVRDNLLDQHGCYVQYLSRNGQPMDAGLSYNQGMVVGRHHSRALLPGILGLRTKTRTTDGHAYIRTDDLFKNLGWKEVEIKEFVRHISYENALVHAQVMGLSGLGPDKTGFEPFYKVLCVLDTTVGIAKTGVIDGDTIYVKDILSNAKFKVRFDGINTPEKAIINSTYNLKKGVITGLYSYNNIYRFKISFVGKEHGLRSGEDITIKNIIVPEMNTPSILNGQHKVLNVGNDFFECEIKIIEVSDLGSINLGTGETTYATVIAGSYTNEIADITNKNSPGYLSTKFVIEALKGKAFVLRIKQNRETASFVTDEEDSKFDAGSENNIEKNYLKEKYGRILATVFYALPESGISSIASYVKNIFVKNNSDLTKIKKEILDGISNPILNKKFQEIYSAISNIELKNHWKSIPNASSNVETLANENLKVAFSIIVQIKKLEEIYANTSKWPMVLWDEYYEDGTPYTLNWELVVNNLANVYTKDIIAESKSVSNNYGSTGIPEKVDGQGC